MGKQNKPWFKPAYKYDLRFIHRKWKHKPASRLAGYGEHLVSWHDAREMARSLRAEGHVAIEIFSFDEVAGRYTPSGSALSRGMSPQGKETTMSFILVGDVPYPVDTASQLEAAKEALAEAGLTRAQVWAGNPDCPDSYPVTAFVFVGDEDRKRYA